LDSPNCQFFGALTFTVKLNGLDPDSPEIDPRQLLEQLLNWYIIAKQKEYRPFVVKKLLSTLSALFVKFPSAWPQPITVMAAIHVTGNIGSGFPGIGDSNEINNIVSRMPVRDINALLEFSVTLVEDLSSNNLTTTLQIEVNDVLNSQVAWFMSLIGTAFGFIGQGQEQYRQDQNSNEFDEIAHSALSGLEVWIVYFANQKISMFPLQSFCNDILRLLKSAEEDQIYIAVSECIQNIYSACNHYWVKSFKDGLREYLVDTGRQLMIIFPELEEENDKINSFVKLLVTYCTDETIHFLKAPVEHSDFHIMLDYLIVFNQNTKVSLIDDSLATELLEFWNAFVEEIVSGGYMSSLEATDVQDYVAKIIDVHWYKIRLPESSIAATWSKDAWEKFRLFRIDFCDFLELVYPLAGIAIFENLAQQIIDMLHNPYKNWEIIESFLYGINALSDLIDDNGREYTYFKRLLDTSLFSDLTSCENVRIRLTAINLIGSYDTFFEREDGRPYITNSLDYLFKSLVFPSLSLNASKSIQKLCSSTRKHIKHMIDTFLSIYRDMGLSSDLDNTSHEKIIYSMSCIIQSLDDLEMQRVYIDQIIEILTNEISIAVPNTRDLTDASSLRVRSLLKCVERLGKGLQAPEEQDELPKEIVDRINEFWNEGRSVRDRILLIVKEISLDRPPFNQDFEVCETCCNILKAGFSETIVTAFGFPTDVIVHYISEKIHRGPQSCVSLLVDLARCLLSREGGTNTVPGLDPVYIDTLLDLFFAVNAVKDYEPEAQVGNLKFVTQLISTDYYQQYLLQDERVLVIIEICVQLLNSSERFVLRAASQFWAKFITVEGAMKFRVEEILQMWGPTLTGILIGKVAGDCARSELDYYCDVIKKIIFKYSLISRPWFAATIVDNPFPLLAKKDSKFRSQFLSRLFALRGSRETNHAVKEFWLACRGMIDYT
jgi:hypothetical protein